MEALNQTPGTPAIPAAPARIRLPYWIRDFALVRPAVLTFVATVGVSLACVLGTYWQLRDARQAEVRAHATRDAARSSDAYVESEKQEIRTYQPLFLDLRRRHVVGVESRLDWVEAIREIQERRRLLPLTYEIEPQQPYKLAGRLQTGDYQLRGSRMTLHMNLLHEGDLLDFLGDLRQHGIFTVQQCQLRRATTAPNAAPTAGLAADCTVNWLTLTPPARPPGGPR